MTTSSPNTRITSHGLAPINCANVMCPRAPNRATGRARGPSLLRTAFLLTGDRSKAEDLVQTALGKTWPKWGSIQAQPREAYVRKVMVNTYIAWWHRRWNAEDPTEHLPDQPVSDGDTAMRVDLLSALGGLPRGQRAVIVLR